MTRISTLLLYTFISLSCQAQRNNFDNTRWKLVIDNQITDTLILNANGQGYYYSAEHDDKTSIIYKVSGDTLKFDVYDYVSEMKTEKGKEIVSKWILVKKNRRLHIIYLGHKIENTFVEVPTNIYTKLGEFEILK